MKNMKLSLRLFLSFGLILALLVTIVVMEYNTIVSLSSRKNKLLNAVDINDGTKETRRWTLGYYLTNSDDYVTEVENNYNKTRNKIDEGLKLHKAVADLDTLKTMKGQLDQYYDSFNTYKGYVEENDTYSSNMVKCISSILVSLNTIMKDQKSAYTESEKNLKKICELKRSGKESLEDINGSDIVAQMNDKHVEVGKSYDSVICIQDTMIAELRYLLRNNDIHDKIVYQKLDELRMLCDWMKKNFDEKSDIKNVEDINGYISEYIVAYESYKGLLDSMEIEQDKLHNLAFSITEAADNLAKNQEQKMSKSMCVAIIFALSIGVASIILGVLLAIIITKGLVKQLTSNMNELSKSADLVLVASTQLSSASEQLSQSSNEQAASIEETSSTIDETASMVKRNAENTMQANGLSKEASKAASVGLDKMNNMTKSMEELKKSSSEISKIIKVIDEIAFQTNMLALNAAVEAARAGDAGQGFAVVAQEVRNLAQKSAKAAKDTAEIIEKNIELSEQGVTISADVNIALDEIMSKTKSVNQLIAEITAASDEQARGANQVTEVINQMEEVVQINTATAEENAASSEELEKQARALEGIVEEISKLIKGSKGVVKADDSTYEYDNNSSKNKKTLKNSNNENKIANNSYRISPDDVIPLDENDDF